MEWSGSGDGVCGGREGREMSLGVVVAWGPTVGIAAPGDRGLWG